MPPGLARALGFVTLGALPLGCAGGSPIASLAGEVHLHQYDDGAHLEVLFVDPPTPIALTSFDSALPGVPPTVYDQAPCSAYTLETCQNDGCKVPDPIDGGPVTVDGLAMPVRFQFDKMLGYYDDVIVLGPFLAGGTRATIHGAGGGKIPPFDGEVIIPDAFSPSSTLDQGIGAGLDVSWTPGAGDGSRVRVLLSAVPQTGFSVVASCELDDADGDFRVPDALLARMPPAPRELQLEVSRYRIVNVPLGDGRGVVVHGGFSVLTTREEP